MNATTTPPRLRPLRILHLGLREQSVHARCARQSLGWAIEHRRRGERRWMRECALEFRREIEALRPFIESLA